MTGGSVAFIVHVFQCYVLVHDEIHNTPLVVVYRQRETVFVVPVAVLMSTRMGSGTLSGIGGRSPIRATRLQSGRTCLSVPMPVSAFQIAWPSEESRTNDHGAVNAVEARCNISALSGLFNRSIPAPAASRNIAAPG